MKKAFLEDVTKIVVKDVPKPRPTSNEVLIKVHCCSICGTDLHGYRLGPEKILERLPTIPGPLLTVPGMPERSFYGAIGNEGGGHQISGEIVEVGDDVNKWRVGDRVIAVGIGGFAEYATSAPFGRIYPLPKEITYEEGSYIEPLAAAVAAVRRSRLQLGETAVVLGGGPVGQLVLQCAKIAGAMVYVTEIAEMRVELARKFADEVINPMEVDVVERVYELTDGVGPDVIFECAGKGATMKQLVEMARENRSFRAHGIFPVLPYGMQTRGVLVALYEEPWAYDLFDNNAICGKNLEIIGSMTYEDYGHPKDELKIALELVRTRRVKVTHLITAEVPLDDIDKGFKALLSGEELGVVVKP